LSQNYSVAQEHFLGGKENCLESPFRPCFCRATWCFAAIFKTMQLVEKQDIFNCEQKRSKSLKKIDLADPLLSLFSSIFRDS